LISAVVGRSVDPEAFGFFTLIATVVLVAFVFFGVGSSTAIREITRDPGRERSLFEGLMGWGRLCGCSFGILLLVGAALEDSIERRLVLASAALGMPFMAPAVLIPALILRRAEQDFGLTNTLNQVLALIGSLAFSLARVTGTFYALLPVLRALANALWLRRLAERELGYRVRPALHERGLWLFLQMASVQAAAEALPILGFHADIFLVRWLLADSESGVFAAAFQWIVPLLAIPGLFMLPLIPVFSSAVGLDRDHFCSHVRSTAAVVSGLGALTGVIVGFLAPDLLYVVYAGRYTDAAASLRWYCTAFAFFCATSSFTTALLAERRERVLMRLSATTLLFNLLTTLFLLPRHGIAAAPAATAAAQALLLACTASTVLSLRELAGLTTEILRTSVPACVAALVLLALSGFGLAPSLAAAAVVSSLGLCWILRTARTPGCESGRRPA
jgi:O-antigen/teichoic acid export membrane protein